jgi:hypothetical protein
MIFSCLKKNSLKFIGTKSFRLLLKLITYGLMLKKIKTFITRSLPRADKQAIFPSEVREEMHEYQCMNQNFNFQFRIKRELAE